MDQKTRGILEEHFEPDQLVVSGTLHGTLHGIKGKDGKEEVEPLFPRVARIIGWNPKSGSKAHDPQIQRTFKLKGSKDPPDRAAGSLERCKSAKRGKHGVARVGRSLFMCWRSC